LTFDLRRPAKGARASAAAALYASAVCWQPAKRRLNRGGIWARSACCCILRRRAYWVAFLAQLGAATAFGVLGGSTANEIWLATEVFGAAETAGAEKGCGKRETRERRWRWRGAGTTGRHC